MNLLPPSKTSISIISTSILTKSHFFMFKKSFNKIEEKSFDYAILEKSNEINGIKLNIPWSDLGSWYEISNIFQKYKIVLEPAKKIQHQQSLLLL